MYMKALFGGAIILALNACDSQSMENDQTQPAAEPDAPVLSAIGNKSVLSGDTLSFTLDATDPNDRNLEFLTDGTLGPNNNPYMANPSATFSAMDARFQWATSDAVIGHYSVQFSVYNDAVPPLSDSETIIIEVMSKFDFGESLYIDNCQSCHGSKGSRGNEQILQCIDEQSLLEGMNRGPMSSIGNGFEDYDRDVNAIWYYLNNVVPENC